MMLKESLERDEAQGVAHLVSGYAGKHLGVSHGYRECCVPGT